uniref:Crinkler effector protein N-terminal domain-containing protein n=1 Tax=Phytophthora ramorum TaxID=164328 RepID=H3H4Z7_PHYRM
MVKLFCAIVGVAGSAFPVDIDPDQLVGDLKDAIKGENPATITCDAKDLQVFLAKMEGSAWLDGAGAAAVALDERGHPQGFVQMDPTLWIKNPKHFGDNFQPGEGQVHVLVVVPGHVRVDIGGTASRALKYKLPGRSLIVC